VVGNVGLGKFNPFESRETKSSLAPKSASSESTASHSSSTSETKTLAKSEKKSETKKLDKKSEEKSEFDKKVEGHVKSNDQKSDSKDQKPEHKLEKSSSSDKLNKKLEAKGVDQKVDQDAEDVEISKKIEAFLKSHGKSELVDLKKLDKKQLKALEQEINQKGADINIPQMLMLQGVQPTFVNQAAKNQEAADAVKLNIEKKVSDQTKPVLKFMKAMQENFGIQPNQIMKALSEMPQQTMLESPNKAMTPLFEKLGLQPKEFTKAQILYTEMLTEMEQVQPELFKPGMGVGAGAVLSQSTFGRSELPAQMLEKPMTAQKSTLDQLIEQKISRRALEPQNMQVPKMPQQQINMAQVFHVDPTKNPLSEESSVAMDKLGEFDPQLRIQDVKINPDKISDQFGSSISTLAAGGTVPVLGKELKKDMSEKEMKDQLADQMAQMPGDKKIDGQFALDKLAPTAAASAGALAPNQLSNENVEKILSGSQSLIQKGGGEMKIQLSPEGLGNVHLEIKVKDGQVGIQMMADTQEAKKLLETSMNDLKLSLADHKLNLNHVKVDVSEQSSNNMQQNFKREEARDFLGQFRQFNESFRGSNDIAASRAYGKKDPTDTPDIQPIQSKAKKSSDGRLHLVA
jgi:flagellar hook-length control protein FliK